MLDIKYRYSQRVLSPFMHIILHIDKRKYFYKEDRFEDQTFESIYLNNENYSWIYAT